MIKKFMPAGPHCVRLRVFGESLVCPDLDEQIVRKPLCLRYNVVLGWNVSGRVLKCNACLKAGGVT